MSLGSLWLEGESGPNHESPGEGARYYPVSSFKFGVMSVFTLGVYHIYWFYKNCATSANGTSRTSGRS